MGMALLTRKTRDGTEPDARPDAAQAGAAQAGAAQAGTAPGAAPSCGCSGNGACSAGGLATLEPVATASSAGPLRVALVGAPNVGKSTLFNRLTGAYVTVSNYPGTSIEVDRGHGRMGGRATEVMDTPGMYSLLPTSEEERVARRLVLEGGADVLVQVADAKNLERALPLTLQLLETGRPLVLAANMMDEADSLGVRVDHILLAERLGVAVVPIAAVRGRGLEALEAAIVRAAGSPSPVRPRYSNGVGDAIERVRSRMSGTYPVDAAAYAALLIQGDAEVAELVAAAESDAGEAAIRELETATSEFADTAVYRVAYERHRVAERALDGAVRDDGEGGFRLRDRLGTALTRPLIGVPILLGVLYLGLYQFVGVFGAGTVVDWLEGTLFEERLNPFFEQVFGVLVPWEWLRGLFVGDYGVLTLGVRYAVAIILPIVGTFFLFFSVLEDSGYFPRLALLVDRVFKRIGLSGRAVIPMVLGFACGTMATMVTRTLETRRERVLSTILLALAIPCSAQLGVIVAILAGNGAALSVLALVLGGVFLLVGWLAAQVMPGEGPVFHMELPPLRLPRLGNVVAKTTSRMQWYFMEVLPLFLLASVILWIGDLTGLLQAALRALTPVVALLGLPAETAQPFLFGFFRRDYGAAGLFDLSQQGMLSTVQLTVAAVTLTLFVPCVAMFLMMLKERGVKTALGIVAFVVPFAFGVGAVLNVVLRGLGW
jgi:ferrous iron transport protein B